MLGRPRSETTAEQGVDQRLVTPRNRRQGSRATNHSEGRRIFPRLSSVAVAPLQRQDISSVNGQRQ